MRERLLTSFATVVELVPILEESYATAHSASLLFDDRVLSAIAMCSRCAHSAI